MSTLRAWSWPDGYIQGVGRVPGGPRIVQIGSGSVAVVPPEAYTRVASPDLIIKSEPIERIPILRDNAQNSAASSLPEEEYLGSIEEDIHEFGHNDLIAAINSWARDSEQMRRSQSFRHNGAAAVRQRLDLSTRIRSRGRSRSPARNSLSSSGSSMFFTDSSRESSIVEAAARERTSSSSNLSSFGPSDPVIKQENDTERCEKCNCPISYDCTVRAVYQLDCRCMVLEWKSWGYRSDQEAFDRHRMARPFGERFTNVQTIISIVPAANDFQNATSALARRRAERAITQWIYDMEDVTIEAGPQQQAVTQQVIPRLSNFLDPNNQQVRQHSGLPDFIEEELTVLCNKWGRGDFSGSLTRGLDEIATFDINGFPLRVRHVVNPDWQHHYGGDAKNFGNNGCVNGQIWLKRVEMMRDGMHAAPIAGISGNPRVGAYSVVLGAFDERNNEGYANIDMGDVIEYMGTALPDDGNSGPNNVVDPHLHNPNSWTTGTDCQDATSATRALFTSQETGEPVRVIRSWKMCERVNNKPRRGYRYDGLYRVVRRTALKEARQIWSFRLERLPGQGQLRGFEPHNTYPDSKGSRHGHHLTR